MYILSDLLTSLGLTHCFSTRAGGVSPAPYDSLNFAARGRDSLGNVRENYRRIAVSAGFDPESLVLTSQRHTLNIMDVTSADRGKGYSRERGYDNVDALVTNAPGLTLCCFSADCAPVLFFDPVRRVIACAHSGWRGTLGGIAALTAGRMAEAYGCAPADIRCCIGPHIRQCCFEVDGDVADFFANRGTDTLPLIEARDSGKYHIDLAGFIRQDLLQAGLRAENIDDTGYCTKCRPDLFFSHRRDGKDRGTMAAMVGL